MLLQLQFIFVLSAANDHTYALSLRDFDEKTQSVHVRHYQIVHADGRYYISTGMQFSDLLELVEYYRRE
jgi:SH2 domain